MSLTVVNRLSQQRENIYSDYSTFINNARTNRAKEWNEIREFTQNE